MSAALGQKRAHIILVSIGGTVRPACHRPAVTAAGGYRSAASAKVREVQQAGQIEIVHASDHCQLVAVLLHLKVDQLLLRFSGKLGVCQNLANGSIDL